MVVNLYIEDISATDPMKIEAISEWKPPTNVKEIQAFLGMVGFYRQYIADFATVARPLTFLTSKGVPCRWEQGEQLAFEELKKRLEEITGLSRARRRVHIGYGC